MVIYLLLSCLVQYRGRKRSLIFVVPLDLVELKPLGTALLTRCSPYPRKERSREGQDAAIHG